MFFHLSQYTNNSRNYTIFCQTNDWRAYSTIHLPQLSRDLCCLVVDWPWGWASPKQLPDLPATKMKQVLSTQKIHILNPNSWRWMEDNFPFHLVIFLLQPLIFQGVSTWTPTSNPIISTNIKSSYISTMFFFLSIKNILIMQCHAVRFLLMKPVMEGN